MPELVSIMLPSMGRPEQLRKALTRIRETTQSHLVELLVAIDDDEESAMLAEPLVDSISYSEVRRGVTRAFADLLQMSKGDYLVPLGDDLMSHDGWLDAALVCHRDTLNGYGLVGLNDGRPDKDTATIFLCDRKFCIEQLNGCIAIPHYGHYYSDTEVSRRAQRAKAYAWCDAARIDHEHVPDGLLLGRNVAADEAMFWSRKAAGFPDDFARVI